MSQQINLYLPEFKVKKDPLTAVLMGQILGGVVVVMVLVSGYQFFSRWQLNSELTQLRATLQEETRKTTELDEVLARRSQSDELTERLESAESRLLSRRQIRDFLGGIQLGNVVGFSHFFMDLSRAAIDGLRITEFEIGNGGSSVSISGETIDSAMIPRYVRNLETGNSALRDTHFNPKISRPNVTSQYFSFEMSSANE